MFPFTPIEAHEGCLKGRERVIAAVSFETDWEKPSPPRVISFNLSGLETPSEGKAKMTGSNGRWHIQTTLNDWQEIVVVE